MGVDEPDKYNCWRDSWGSHWRRIWIGCNLFFLSWVYVVSVGYGVGRPTYSNKIVKYRGENMKKEVTGEQSPTMADTQAEIAGIESVLVALGNCSKESRIRILSYAVNFYGIAYEVKCKTYGDY